MLEVVSEQVHGHGGHGHIHLTAGWTFLCQLTVQRAVCLFVPTQVGRRGVGFSALIAGVPLDGPGTADSFPPRAAVGDEEGIDCVTLTHSSITVDVTVSDFRARTVRRLRVRGTVVTVDTIVEGVRGGNLDPTVTLTIIHNRADVVTDVTSCHGKKKTVLGYRTLSWKLIYKWVYTEAWHGNQRYTDFRLKYLSLM